jgi:hypothetical protein
MNPLAHFPLYHTNVLSCCFFLGIISSPAWPAIPWPTQPIISLESSLAFSHLAVDHLSLPPMSDVQEALMCLLFIATALKLSWHSTELEFNKLLNWWMDGWMVRRFYKILESGSSLVLRKGFWAMEREQLESKEKENGWKAPWTFQLWDFTIFIGIVCLISYFPQMLSFWGKVLLFTTVFSLL